MAIGDKALARGMRLTPGTVLANTIDDEINRALDYIADFTSTVEPISGGGTGATTAAGARQNLGFPALGVANQADANALPVYNASAQLTSADPTASGHVANKAYVDARELSIRQGAQQGIDEAKGQASAAQSRADEANGNGIAARQGNLYTDSYNRVISGTRRAAWLQDNGQLGYAASSERYKKLIRPEDVSDEQLLQLTLVSYQWKAAVAVDDRREMGLIAERMVEAGIGWACFYGEDGVEGINYEMVALAILPAVQRLITRTHRLDEDLDVLAQRLTALEGGE